MPKPARAKEIAEPIRTSRTLVGFKNDLALIAAFGNKELGCETVE
jgi:hypothetical protein